MKFFSTLSALAAGMLVTGASATPFSFSQLHARNDTGSCISPRAIPDYKAADFKNFGMVLFRAIDMIDVFGPLDPLQLMALTTQNMNLHFIAETLDPIKTQPASMNKFNSSFFPTIPVTNTFDDDLDLDVLIIPGGPGVRAPGLEPVQEYIKKMYPKVKLLLTVCTGSSLAAKAGVLDDHLATTNKNAWKTMIESGPNVHWVSPARYTIDGNVWTSSGVTSSLDLVFAFIETYWGKEEADRIGGIIEHVPREWNDDPFSAKHGIPKTETQPCDSTKADCAH